MVDSAFIHVFSHPLFIICETQVWSKGWKGNFIGVCLNEGGMQMTLLNVESRIWFKSALRLFLKEIVTCQVNHALVYSGEMTWWMWMIKWNHYGNDDNCVTLPHIDNYVHLQNVDDEWSLQWTSSFCGSNAWSLSHANYLSFLGWRTINIFLAGLSFWDWFGIQLQRWNAGMLEVMPLAFQVLKLWLFLLAQSNV